MAKEPSKTPTRPAGLFPQWVPIGTVDQKPPEAARLAHSPPSKDAWVIPPRRAFAVLGSQSQGANPHTGKKPPTAAFQKKNRATRSTHALPFPPPHPPNPFLTKRGARARRRGFAHGMRQFVNPTPKPPRKATERPKKPPPPRPAILRRNPSHPSAPTLPKTIIGHMYAEVGSRVTRDLFPSSSSTSGATVHALGKMRKLRTRPLPFANPPEFLWQGRPTPAHQRKTARKANAPSNQTRKPSRMPRRPYGRPFAERILPRQSPVIKRRPKTDFSRKNSPGRPVHPTLLPSKPLMQDGKNPSRPGQPPHNPRPETFAQRPFGHQIPRPPTRKTPARLGPPGWGRLERRLIRRRP